MKCFRFVLIITGLFVLAGIFFECVLAEYSHNEINLEKGKNYVKIEGSFYVSEIVLLNPNIEYVLYFDEFLNEQIEYVNVFGGIGKNFLVIPDETYEISVKKDTELKLPERI